MSSFDVLVASLENAGDGFVAELGNGFGIGVQTSEGYFGGNAREIVLVVRDREGEWTIPFGQDGENLSCPIALDGDTSVEEAVEDILVDYRVILGNKRMLHRALAA